MYLVAASLLVMFLLCYFLCKYPWPDDAPSTRPASLAFKTADVPKKAAPAPAPKAPEAAPKTAEAAPLPVQALEFSGEVRHLHIWPKVKEKLLAVYAEMGRSPVPMSSEEADALMVPAVCDGSKMMPLPWDVKLLAQFDRNILIDTKPPLVPLLHPILSPETRHFVPDRLIKFSFENIARYKQGSAAQAEEAARLFMTKGGQLPAVLSLGEVGWHELPALWLAAGPAESSVVLHLDYDDVPEFYVRSLCFLEYVYDYIDWNGRYLKKMPGNPRTDRSNFLAPEEGPALFERLNPQLAALNEAVRGSLAAFN